MQRLFKFFIVLISLTVIIVIAGIAAMVAINGIVMAQEEGNIVSELTIGSPDIEDDAAKRIKKLDPECAIVLGAGITDSETPSPMLRDRLDAGILLYNEGLVDKLLLTGDNGQQSHNEIHVMLKYCKERGVPKEKIFCDHAGFSTYDSMYRAVSVFQVKRAVVVTQKYHLYRALYLARSRGIDALGVASDQEGPYFGQSSRDLREFLARIKDFFKDKRSPAPTLGGEEIPISNDSGVSTHGE